MRLNSLFTTGLTVPYFFFSCCIKWQNNFLKCWISAGPTMGSFIDVPNYFFSFWCYGSLITPTRSAVGSHPARVCGFRHTIMIVSLRHGSGGSALAWFLLFDIYMFTSMWRSSLNLWWFVVPLTWHRKGLVVVLYLLTCLYKTNVIGARFILWLFLITITPFFVFPYTFILLILVYFLPWLWGSGCLCKFIPIPFIYK